MVNKDFISKLQVTNFRNYKYYKAEFNCGLVIIYGKNGSGKTNLLEAISLFSPGRGLRRSAYKYLTNHDSAEPFTVNIDLHNSEYGVTNFGTTVNAQHNVRKLHINQSTSSLDNLTQYCSILWLTPLMDRLFLGPSSDRCRFLDRLVFAFEPIHGLNSRNYEKIMRSRNYILQEDSLNDRLLSSYEKIMADLAVKIAISRNNLVKLLQEIINQFNEDDLLLKSEIFIQGEVENLVKADISSAVDILCEKLKENRLKDKLSKRSSLGTHRSDFLANHKAKNMPAALCSTGEQKSLLLNLILAQSQLNVKLYNAAPILLLDELGAHFDKEKRAKLAKKLQDYPGQIIITATDRELFDLQEHQAQFIELSNN